MLEAGDPRPGIFCREFSAPWTRLEDLFTDSTDLAVGSARWLGLAQVPTPDAKERRAGLHPQDVRGRHLEMEIACLVPGLSFSVCTRRALHPKPWKGLGAPLPLPQLHPGANQKLGWWQSLSPAPARGFAFSRFQGPRCPLTGRADWVTDLAGGSWGEGLFLPSSSP